MKIKKIEKREILNFSLIIFVIMRKYIYKLPEDIYLLYTT